MKQAISRLGIILSVAFLTMGGCATGYLQYATPENARSAAAIVCSNTIRMAVTPAEQVDTAKDVYACAHGVRTLAGGKIPTQQELRDTLKLFVGDNANAEKWLVFREGIAIIYGGIYAKLNGNGVLAAQYLEAIAAGCEDAASGFLVQPPSKTAALKGNGWPRTIAVAGGVYAVEYPYLKLASANLR